MKNITQQIKVPGPKHLTFVEPRRGRGRPRKNGNSTIALLSALPQVLFIGQFTLSQQANHNIWLAAPGFDPMQVDPLKLEKLLKAFHRKNF